MSVETVGKFSICTCNVKTCCGKGKSWVARFDHLPKVCRWCRNPNWNRETRQQRTERMLAEAKIAGTK